MVGKSAFAIAAKPTQAKRVKRRQELALFFRGAKVSERGTKPSFAKDMIGIVYENHGKSDAKSVGKVTDVLASYAKGWDNSAQHHLLG